MKRVLRARKTDALAVMPATATDLSAPAVFGLEAEPFRATVRKLGCRHVIVGKRMIVTVADFVDALERAATAEQPVDRDHQVSDGEPTADQLLARIGRSRTAA